MGSMQINRLPLSLCHGSEGKRWREELRAIILPKERRAYVDKTEEEEREEDFLTTEICIGVHHDG